MDTVVTDMPETTDDQEESLVRTEHFDADGPLEIEVSIGSGRVDIELVDEPGAGVTLRPHDGGDSGFMHGLSNLMHWVNDRFGDPAAEQDAAVEAVDGARIELTGRRLVVRSGHGQMRMMPLELVPVAVTVRAPVGSHLDLRSGEAAVTVTGAAGRIRVTGGSGDITVDRADGRAEIKLGSGALRLGPMLGGLRARSGSGEIEVSSVGGPTTLVTGSGDVWLGAVQSDVMARTGSGDLVVADAACGDVELVTGSGEIRVGVRPGTAAMVDLHSGSGQARSELKVSDRPPADGPRLRVRGRTRSGNAVVTTAAG
jgi:hypothetical protein